MVNNCIFYTQIAMLFRKLYLLFIMLTGSELIAKTKELKGVSESEKVIACGYFSTSKNGKKEKTIMHTIKQLLKLKDIKVAVITKQVG